MPVDPKLQELIDRWEDLQEQGEEVSAQELCSEHPELLEELKRRIKALKAMSWLLEDDSSTDGSEPKGPAAPLPPTLGRYRLDELVGVGGFAQVWKGYDPELQRVVAIKVPRSDRFSAEQADRFIEEARKVAQLRHPGIVPVHDAGRDGSYCFIVSDFIEGGSLGKRLSNGPLGWRESARLIAELAEALDHAHRRGFIHRDIKPANILLDHQGQPYLTDFGIALTSKELDDRSPSIGTLAYMSPEQIAEDQLDCRTDIYSLGVVFFELLTGQRPFSAPSSKSLREKILSASPAQVQSAVQAVPTELARICSKCLQKNRLERYTAASEVAAALRDFLRRSARRSRPRTYVLGLLSLLTLIGVGAFFFWPRQQPHDAETGRPQAEPPRALSFGAGQPVHPADVAVLLANGVSLFDRKEYQEAAAEFTEVIRQNPRLAEAYHRRGGCYFNLGEVEKALGDFSQALEVDPRNAEARNHRALAYLRLQQFDAALADAQEAIRLDPGNAQDSSVLAMVYRARASGHNNRGRWAEALADADQVVRLEPGNAEAYAVRGTIRYNMHAFDRAIADLSKAIEISPDDPHRYQQRADSLRAAGRIEEARADEEKARSLREKREARPPDRST